ncbi:MAG TPA: hypothetical protein VFM93_10295 [Candidatus Limnocylindria bacterium]|nr:hypothetical protein [Candidatus Limnocylindria bacterium]
MSGRPAVVLALFLYAALAAAVGVILVNGHRALTSGEVDLGLPAVSLPVPSLGTRPPTATAPRAVAAPAATRSPATAVTAPARTASASAQPPPRHLALDPATGRTFVAAPERGSITVRDAEGKATATVGVGWSTGLAIDAGRRRLYVITSTGSSGSLRSIDADTLREVASVQVGSAPSALAVDPLAERVLVTLPFAGRVVAYSGRSLTESASIGQQNAVDLAFSPRGDRLYVVSQITSELVMYDGRTLAAGTRARTSWGDVVADDARAYVASGTVVAFGPEGLATVATLGATANAAALDRERGTLYVAHERAGRLSAVDLRTGAVRPVLVDGAPVALALDEQRARLLVLVRSSDVPVALPLNAP